MNKNQIIRVFAREILDSRGNPTIETSALLSDGSVGVASVPSGASTGKFEAFELRDAGSERYGGKGVLEAVYNVNKLISPAICGISAFEQTEVDHAMISLDNTEDKSNLGANAILSVSLAVARSAAASLQMPFYRYIGGAFTRALPIPMMNIINGGAHASNNIDIQEFMILPYNSESFSEGVRMCAEIYKILGRLLKERGYSTAVGDEGGYAPNLASDRDALDFICEAIELSGYEGKIKLALDAAASEWLCEDGTYYLPKRKIKMTGEELCAYFSELAGDYPIMSIEDGMGETDSFGWKKLTEELSRKIMLVGDDLFVTNKKRLLMGIREKLGNAILIKPNQIGTLTQTLDVVLMAKTAGYKTVISHRSGETDDTSIADIAVGCAADFIKSGAPCRGERVAKYNRIMKIESSMQDYGYYGGIKI